MTDDICEGNKVRTKSGVDNNTEGVTIVTNCVEERSLPWSPSGNKGRKYDQESRPRRRAYGLIRLQ